VTGDLRGKLQEKEEKLPQKGTRPASLPAKRALRQRKKREKRCPPKGGQKNNNSLQTGNQNLDELRETETGNGPRKVGLQLEKEVVDVPVSPKRFIIRHH